MINYFSETDFELNQPQSISNWISNVISSYNKEEGDITFVFCEDAYLLELNKRFLNHNTLTDIISFDDTLGNLLNGEIYISVERVKENASEFDQSFIDELHRVIIHGVLHFIGFKDKTEADEQQMRNAENKALASRDFIVD